MNRAAFEAAESGDFAKLMGLINEPHNLDHLLTTQKNDTILHMAIRSEKMNFAKQVLELCPQLLSKPNSDGETPLHMAARNKSQRMVELLLAMAKCGDVEKLQAVDVRAMLRARNKDKGDTALHVGVRNGHLEVAKLLVKEDVEQLGLLNGAKETPMFLAVEGRFFDIAGVFLNKCGSCSPEVFDGSNGMNALHAAVIRTQHATSLEHHVPDLSLAKLRRHIRSFVLHIEEHFEWFSHQTETDIIGLLLKRDEIQKTALLEKQDDVIHWTPLHFAAYLGHLEATKLILEQKCSSVTFLKDKEGMPALHIAAKEGHVAVVEEILRRRPEACELVDQRGRTILHVAVVHERLNVVRYVLKTQKVEFLLNVGDNEGNTALHLAVGRRKLWIMKVLVDDVRVDKRATNLKHLKPVEIVRANADIGELVRGWLVKKLERQGGQESLRSIDERVENSNQTTEDHNRSSEEASDDKNKLLLFNHHSPETKPLPFHKVDKATKSRRLKKISSTHLLVAAIIATVTFTAAFTIPGGFDNGPSPDKGMAVLSNSVFFKVFVIADSIAFYCSSASVLLQFFSSVEHSYHRLLRFTRVAATLTYVSIFGMVVAFASGLRVVVPGSSKLAEYTVVMGCFCVFLFIIGCL